MVIRRWVKHRDCGHQSPLDIPLSPGQQFTDTQWQALIDRSPPLCPACAPLETPWQWSLNSRDRSKRDLPKLDSHAAELARINRLVQIDRYLMEARKVLESPWKPRNLEAARERLRTALKRAQTAESINKAVFWTAHEDAKIETFLELAELEVEMDQWAEA